MGPFLNEMLIESSYNNSNKETDVMKIVWLTCYTFHISQQTCSHAAQTNDLYGNEIHNRNMSASY